jgi:hypothetical protein
VLYRLPKHNSAWRLLDESAKHGANSVMNRWYALVEAYSRRQLTMKRDKLPAISGIASEVAQLRTNDTYVAGLWKRDMIKGLSWFPDPTFRHRAKKDEWPPRQPDEGVPTWSWAAFDGPIIHYGGKWSSHCKAIRSRHNAENWDSPAIVQLSGVETTQASRDPFGRVSGGAVRLDGWTLDITISEDLYESDFRGHLFKAKCYRLPDSFRYPSSMRIYFDTDPEELPRVSVTCLQLGNGLSPRGTDADVGLVLMSVNEHENRLFRVGLFDVERTDRKWLSFRKRDVVTIE